jgi:hypothetical protein
LGRLLDDAVDGKIKALSSDSEEGFLFFGRIPLNRNRFPDDFMFQLTSEEKTEVVANCDHLTKPKVERIAFLGLIC